MKIGIIGAGGIGGTIGKHWSKAGHQVFFSSRNPEKLQTLVVEAGNGAQAGTVKEAAQFADVILLATYYWTTDDAIKAAGSLAGKIIIDATNPYIRNDSGQIQRLPGVSAALELAEKLPESSVVKAYNTLPTATFANQAHLPEAERLVVFYSGDDESAKSVVANLIADSGFIPLDAGTLAQAAVDQEPGGKLYNKPLTLDTAKQILAIA